MPRLSTVGVCGVLVVLLALYRLASLQIASPTIPKSAATWLNLTLERNERLYQDAIRHRKIEIDGIGGIYEASFPKPQDRKRYALWDWYVPAFSCPFPVYRVGVLGDGGKFICGIERVLKSKPDCIVYSMGVEQKSSFEQEILHMGRRCQVFGFDFSVSQWGPELRQDHAVKDRAHFFPYLIGDTDKHDATPPQYTLRGIMKELDHDFIDILKIDIEGAEFPTLKALIQSFKGEPLPFGQLSVEIHVIEGHLHIIDGFDRWWRMLEDAGLRPFWTELNMVYQNVFRVGPLLAEWSFMNIRGKHALLDDTLPDYP
ncbi:Methyltranfer-dom domain-containing protein [Mycena kentingensis (nom. inval.)]|nr:Methyltranfer-dom domain-containing protein [Mycena kentingensis (nom. inval.)]